MTSLPQNYIKNAGNLAMDIGYSGWGAASGNVSKSQDTTHHSVGSDSLNLTVTVSGGHGHVDYDFGSNDFWFTYNNGMFLNCYCDIDPGSGTLIVLYFINSNGTSYWTINLRPYWQGWNTIYVPPSQCYAHGSMTMDTKWRTLRIEVYGSTGETPSISIDSLYNGVERQPVCLIQFDDAFVSQYSKAYDYLHALGMKGTLYIPSSYVDSGATRLTTAECTEMYNDGWAIANHSKTHSNWTSLTTQAQFESEISQCTSWQQSNGFNRSLNHFAYPLGYMPTEAIAACSAQGILTARGTDNKDLSQQLSNYVSNMQVNIFMLDDSSASTIISSIDDAIKYQKLFVFQGHQVEDTTTVHPSIQTSIFETVIDYLYSKKSVIPCLTIDEWYNRLTNPRYSSILPTRSIAGTRQIRV